MSDLHLILCPDSDRFPMSDEDRQLADDFGVGLIEIRGHDIADLRAKGQDAVGCLAWGGRYGVDAFDAMPRLRALARCGAGTDSLDLVEARRRGVIVTFVPGASDEEVSDHTIALMLACLRQVVFADISIRRGEWPSAVQLTSMRRVRGTRLGLVGFGRIAAAVATKAIGLGMKVAAYDPFVPAEAFRLRGVTQALSLIDLLGQSDVVSLHVPPPGDGSPILGDVELRSMRPGAVLINTGRGSLVDESSLQQALSSGHLSSAGLDVFQSEPLPIDSGLIALENVVLTPHSAAFSHEALAAIRRTALSDAIAVINGSSPVYPVEFREDRKH